MGIIHFKNKDFRKSADCFRKAAECSKILAKKSHEIDDK